MTKFKTLLSMVIACAWLMACAGSEYAASGAMAPTMAEPQMARADMASARAERLEAESAPALPPAPPEGPDDAASVDGTALPEETSGDVPKPSPRSEKLIYRAQLSIATQDPEARMKEMVELARTEGGYLLQQRDTTLQIRIPSERFYAIVEQLEKAGEVQSRHIDVQDVTERYLDLETRIRAAEALQQRLIELLARADKVADALQIEAQLSRVAEQLELYKGQLRRLQELVAYSTIEVHWARVAEEHVGTTPGLPYGWLGTLGLGYLLQLEDQ